MALDFKRSDIGLPPGSAVYVGDRHPEEIAISIIGYDPVGSWAKSAETIDELLQYRNTSGITWINVNGFRESDAISRLAEVYKIHPLTIEDILNTEHRPKVEEFDDYLFITLKEISNPEDSPFVFDQISIVLTANTVITFQETAGDSFDGIRKRILSNLGRVRKYGADYLAYSLMDSVVDRYFLVLDSLGATIEDFEERAVDAKDVAFISDLQETKQRLHHARRAIWPLRESLSILLRTESVYINEILTPFLKDLQDNVIQAAETVESYREAISGIMEVHLSAASNRLNKVMKVLTIISTIFIPLTFIVGVYGMNFTHMPELNSVYGYPIVWGIMILIALGMIAFFKSRDWL
ncbi:magnesium/cobalt transporter CorA [Treponema primitia]|uniref:magnesium/cobalt transporter CorA n=1 Tax=Treponema primitia TaxID=88058 RepID=UPI0002554D6A|nr:magnesium/cobalt transporter CorA [Treponema primitia]